MRFCENGPSIPSKLLTDRDAGKVIFFCGAGVSMNAGLPDFFNLADKVMNSLNVPKNDNLRQELEEKIDHVFFDLRKEFGDEKIESTVVNVLKDSFSFSNVDLSTHEIILNLATTSQGRLQLVTTNFDRLFDIASTTNPQIFIEPKLSDPLRPEEIDGIIYLHGCVNETYTGTHSEKLILSSGDFGDAYMVGKNITKFIKMIMEQYTVVFIGYKAGEPLVDYLFKGLNEKPESLNSAYAFTASDDGSVNWKDKGVNPIEYSAGKEHIALWETLEKWAEQAKNPDKWYQSVVDMAMNNKPENLFPHERGQVAYIISTLKGAEKFCNASSPPPAEWLYVFDKRLRYSIIKHISVAPYHSRDVDLLNFYRLDSETAQGENDPRDPMRNRNIPVDSWSAFATNDSDRQNNSDDNFPTFMGSKAKNIPTLPSRLIKIGVWLRQIADQPLTIWWAEQQDGLHFEIQRQINIGLNVPQIPAVIYKAWQYLFEIWRGEDHDPNSMEGYRLQDRIIKEGWCSGVVRQYAVINRPTLKVDPRILFTWNLAKPIEERTLYDLIHLVVHYPEYPNNIDIPNEWLAAVICELRKNLECANTLELEIGLSEAYRLVSINSDSGMSGNLCERTSGLPKMLIYFTSLFERLIQYNIELAKQEMSVWLSIDNIIFCRLKIWVCGNENLVSIQDFCQIIMRLTDESFWDPDHQSDLLFVLVKRWNKLSIETKKKIERRLLDGSEKWVRKEEGVFKEQEAHNILNRITYLAKKECEFTFDLETETARLRQIAPEWKPKYAETAAVSRESRSGFIKEDTDYSLLLSEPLDLILSKAKEITGTSYEDFVERKPFHGLSREKPIRALSALTHAAKRGEYPQWAWHDFLNFNARKDDSPRFSALIAERLTSYPDEVMIDLYNYVTAWFHIACELIAKSYPRTFNKMLDKLINKLPFEQTDDGSSIPWSNGGETDWLLKSINSPVGKLAEILMFHPEIKNLKQNDGFPKKWLAKVEKLLSLDGNNRRYALVIFSKRLYFFYCYNQQWTEEHLLSVLCQDDKDNQSAFWSGVCYQPDIFRLELFEYLKPSLLKFAKDKRLAEFRCHNRIAEITLTAWGYVDEESQKRLITDCELRDVLLHCDDNFRCCILSCSWHNIRDNNPKNGPTLLELMKVWPDQLLAKTPTVRDKLVSLAFLNEKHFPVIVDAILPFLRRYTLDKVPYKILHPRYNIVGQYPEKVLEVFHCILLEDAKNWPEQVGAVLHRISEENSELKQDKKWIELNHKWNARYQ